MKHTLAVRNLWLPLILLACAAAAAFHAAPGLPFINYDDGRFLLSNPFLRQPLSLASFRWALTADLFYDAYHVDYWQPVTLLSRMLDAALFGMKPAGHHAMNLFYHILNGLLLYTLLYNATRARFRSFLAALIFLIHPVQVEAVCWVTARKDLLSTFFGLLAIGAYGRIRDKSSLRGYGMFALFFFLSLAAKPVFVFLPLLLPVLDRWPYAGEARVSSGPRRELLLKFAFVIPGIVISRLAMMHVPEALGHDWPSLIPAHVVTAYFGHLGKFLIPSHLGLAPLDVPPPHPLAAAYAAGGILLITTLLAKLPRVPALLTGWVWYLLLLAPPSGFGSLQDRFLYAPLAGLSIVTAWGLAAWVEDTRWKKMIVGAFLTYVLWSFSVLTPRQAALWRNTELLFKQALSLDPDNAHIRQRLASILADQGRYDEARQHLERPEVLKKEDPEVYTLLGIILAQQGKWEEAKKNIDKAVSLHPEGPDIAEALGYYYFMKGELKNSELHYRKAVELSKDGGWPYWGLGSCLLRQNRPQDALPYLEKAVNFLPERYESNRDYGQALLESGKFREASAVLERVRAMPEAEPVVSANLGVARSSLGDFEGGKKYLTEAVRRDPMNAGFQFNLGLAFAQTGDLRAAELYFRQALELSPGHAGAQQGLDHIDKLRAEGKAA